MIDIKPPKKESSGKDKFIKLFTDLKIDYEEQGNELWIDRFCADGKDGFIIKFYDDGEFKDFDYIGLKPENVQAKELHEISNTLKEILREMRKRKV